jgi:hypothetical protein
MKIFAANCQGAINRPTVRSLLAAQKRIDPDVMFLSETHLDSFPADCLRRNLKMNSMIVNPTTTRSGGVLLLWKQGINIQQLFSAPNYIDVSVHESTGKVWRLTGIYGEPKWEDKYKTWDKLRELKSNSNLPWVVIGDFNEILFSHEKEGGNPRPQNFMQAFRDSLIACDLHDVGYSGDRFTWRRGGVRERLDRATANSDWLTMHPEASLTHLESIKTDHRPILLDTEPQSVVPNNGSTLKFEAKWFKEDSFQEIVETAWLSACEDVGEANVLAKLAHMHASLHAWDKEILQKPKRRLRSAQRKLDRALAGPMSEENEIIDKEQAALIELLLEQDEVHWMQ